MTTHASKFLSLSSFALAAVLSASALAADPPSPTPARAFFNEARELVAQGNYTAACPKFEQSLALEAGLGTQFNLADCWEHLGRVASAQALFIGAAASAKAAGQSEREQVLRDRAAALEPRIPRLVVEVADPDPKLVVKRGDLPLDTDAYGRAKPVDPGSYEIVAKAPGKKSWKMLVAVAPGSAVLTVQVPKLEPEDGPVAALPPKPLAAKAAAPAAVQYLPRADKGGHGPSFAVLSLGGVGVAGLAVGTIMALKYSSANRDAKDTCPSSINCTPEQIAFHDQRVEDARSARSWSYIGFGAGVLGLGAAAAALFLPQSSESERAWTASPLVAADGSLGASLAGKF